MIRQQAFEGKEKMLKGGLHCHTTRSDGSMTPEESIRYHKQNGYDFLAITDHRNYNFQNFAPDTDLTIIPGMEYDNGQLPTEYGFRCFHTVCIGPSKEDGNGFDQDETMNPAKADNQEEYQPYLDEIHAKKNLTFYCHPQWSSTPARYFEKMKGNFAMEIWNSGCAIARETDNDAAYWDELLGQNIRIYGVATDDDHGIGECCKGWVMVRAENNINAILKALEEGKFYSSTGPEIYDFYVNDGKVVIDCSPAAKVKLHGDCMPTRIVFAQDEQLTHVEYDLEYWGMTYGYVRMSVMDQDGNKAWTNPIFLK